MHCPVRSVATCLGVRTPVATLHQRGKDIGTRYQARGVDSAKGISVFLLGSDPSCLFPPDFNSVALNLLHVCVIRHVGPHSRTLFYRTQRQFTAGEGDAAKHAWKVLDKLGDLDIGQSVVVQQRRVLAIEGAEGTNEMIARTAELIDKSQPDTVFVKMAKSGQHIALDMPVFGLETLSYLEKTGIRAVCLEGEKIMLADPLDVISAAADKASISICTFASLSEKADD